MNKKLLHKTFSIVVLALLITVVFGNAAWANEAQGIMDKFAGITNSWWGILQKYAKDLFLLTLTLEVVLFGIRMALQQTQLGEIIGQFVMLLLFAGFILAVINNYEDWAKTVALNGLKPVVASLNPGGEIIEAGHPFALAAKVWEAVLDSVRGAGLWELPKVLVLEIIAIIICVILALISAIVIIVTCEFYIVANVGVLLIGLGGSIIFKDYAINVMRYILSVAFKLFVLQLIVSIGFTIITMASITQYTSEGAKMIGFQDLFMILGQAIILLALAKSLPDTCAGILSGSSINGGNTLMGVSKMAGGMALGVATAGAGAAMAAGLSLKSAASITSGQGLSGFHRAGAMAKTVMNARSQVKMNKSPTMTNVLKSQANAAKAQRNMDKPENQ